MFINIYILIVIVIVIITITLFYNAHNNTYINYNNDNGNNSNDNYKNINSCNKNEVITHYTTKNNNFETEFDEILNDGIVYENDKRLGIDYCLDNNDGYCVEYGISGIAHYYPSTTSSKYYGEMINEHPIQKRADNKYNPLIFPALR